MNYMKTCEKSESLLINNCFNRREWLLLQKFQFDEEVKFKTKKTDNLRNMQHPWVMNELEQSTIIREPKITDTEKQVRLNDLNFIRKTVENQMAIILEELKKSISDDFIINNIILL